MTKRGSSSGQDVCLPGRRPGFESRLPLHKTVRSWQWTANAIIARVIGKFEGKYRFLSNFFEVAVYYDGLVFRSAENAYQASKTDDRPTQEYFQDLEPAAVKKAGRIIPLREGWDGVKLDYMSEVVHAKFTQHRDLRRRLMDTADEELVEGNYWHDEFFGVCDCQGKKPGCGMGNGRNWLGRILMAERAYWIALKGAP